MLEESISMSEAKGWVTSEKYYQELIKNQQSQTEQLKKQRQEMLNEMKAGLESGTIKRGSETWYEQINAIDEITLKLKEAQTQTEEWNNSIREINWQVFDMIQERISNITTESDFLIDLMSNKKLYEDNGKLTNEGLASMGLHGQNYTAYMYQSDKYAEEIAKLDSQIASDPYDQELIKRRQELLELQQESIMNAEEEKNAIRDMVEEGIDKELDSLQELIDKRNEALDSQKEMYEYQQKVAEQTKEISDLEKQMAAYAGDDSEEAKQKIQQIKVDLEEARQNLQETEYDKYISDQQTMMDELYTQYEEILNQRLDNIDALMEDMISEINNNSSTISDAINNAAENVGYTLSDEISSIWSNDSGFSNVIGMYGDKLNTTNSVLGTISENIRKMIEQLNKVAGTDIEGIKDSSAINSGEANTEYKPPKPPDPPKQPTPPANKPIVVGGQINAGNARIYADSYGGGGGSQYYSYDPIYTVLSKSSRGYILVRHHSLSSGWTGWFKESDVKALKVGARRVDDDQYAWTQEEGTEMIVRPSDGAILTPLAKNDSVLTADATKNIWNMANSPTEFIRDNFKPESQVSPASNVGNATYTQNFENIVFSMPNVENYEQLLASMQKDRNFERLINAMTLDRVAGKGALAKRKAIR